MAKHAEILLCVLVVYEYDGFVLVKRVLDVESMIVSYVVWKQSMF